MEAIIFAVVLMVPSIESNYHQAALAAKAGQVSQLNVTEEEKGRRIIPYIRKGMSQKQVEVVLGAGRECYLDMEGFPRFLWYSDLEIVVYLDNHKVRAALSSGRDKNGFPAKLPQP